MNIRNFFSQIGRRLLPVLFLGIVTAAAFLYAQGWFSLTFLAEEEPLPSLTPSSPLASEPDTELTGDIITPDDTTPVRVQIPTPTDPRRAICEDDILRMCGSLYFEPLSVPKLQNAGYSHSTEPYSGSTSLFAFAGGFDFLPKVRSYYDGSEEKVSYVRPDVQSPLEPVYESTVVEVPAVKLYMGYLLLDDSAQTKLYTSDGLYLFSYRTAEYFPAYTRDRQGNPVFYRMETTEEGEKNRGIKVTEHLCYPFAQFLFNLFYSGVLLAVNDIVKDGSVE